MIAVDGEESSENKEWPSKDADSTDVEDVDGHVRVKGLQPGSGNVASGVERGTMSLLDAMDTRGEELGVKKISSESLSSVSSVSSSSTPSSTTIDGTVERAVSSYSLAFLEIV